MIATGKMIVNKIKIPKIKEAATEDLFLANLRTASLKNVVGFVSNFKS